MKDILMTIIKIIGIFFLLGVFIRFIGILASAGWFGFLIIIIIFFIIMSRSQ